MSTPVMAGRSVIVTGAGAGLGRAYAIDLARQGARVVVNDVAAAPAEETAGLVRQAGGEALAHVGSVESTAVADELVSACRDTFGSVDGLVNNAGVLRVRSIWEEDMPGARRLVEVNLIGTMNCGLAALRAMREQARGAIVNISSGSAHATRTGITTYGGTKGGITSLTYGWAAEAVEAGVRVNAVMPLATTAMTHISRPGGVDDPREPAGVAPLVTYLLSDGSAEVNGRVFRYDGRTLCLLPRPTFGDSFDVEDPAAVASGVRTLLSKES